MYLTREEIVDGNYSRGLNDYQQESEGLLEAFTKVAENIV
jgi:hypothetical protein